MRKTLFFVVLVMAVVGCSNESDQSRSATTQKLKEVSLTIDWVPSPEYYGIFVALDRDLFRKAGFNVKINNGTGAPIVANQVASGAVLFGTTTSDNIVRQLARGGSFSRIVPLLKFNPSVIASISPNSIVSLEGLNNRVIGLNKQSSVYQQYLYLNSVGKLNKDRVKELPIGWGGSAQLESKQADAILAYTTNVVVDLELSGKAVTELYFSDYGVHLYGLVLAIADQKLVTANGLSGSDVEKIIGAILEGYRIGGNDTTIAIGALKNIDPTLNELKVAAAVKKIVMLNESKQSNFQELDRWVAGHDVTDASLSAASKLYR